MRRDSIFYHLFQQSPTLLFDLVTNPPETVASYRFDSVAVKEPTFEIDGVFLPPETEPNGVVYFCEVQFYKDERLYERLFGESFLYFYRNRDRFSDWRAVVIYPSRSLEQGDITPYRELLENHDLVYRVYLDQLGEIQHLSLGLALMVLTTVKESAAPTAARTLLDRSQQELPDDTARRAIIDMVTTIMVYKFTQMSRAEVEAMLGLSLQETRVYQEAKEEGREEGREEGERSLVLEQLTSLLGVLPQTVQAKILTLPGDRIKPLSIALLKFNNLDDLNQWLQETE